MDENKDNKEPEETVTPEDDGVQSDAVAKIEELNTAAERVENANARAEEILRIKEVGGESEAGKPPVKKEPETDEEYTERFQKGEVDPLQD